MTARARRKLGLLGPIIVLVGAAVAAVAVWYMLRSRPEAGAVIDEIPIGSDAKLVVRAEANGGDRSFLELRDGDDVRWQALIPHYAGERGRPGLAWNAQAVTVRVERNGRAEVFAFTMSKAHKLGGLRLAPEHEPIRMHAAGPITLTDRVRSYELVGGAGWNQIVAIDLSTGKGVWKLDLGAAPITAGGVEGNVVWLEQGGTRRRFDAASGRDAPVAQPGN